MPPVELAASAAATMAVATVLVQALPVVACRYKTPLAAAGAKERCLAAG
jgi:hypothetical protein